MAGRATTQAYPRPLGRVESGDLRSQYLHPGGETRRAEVHSVADVVGRRQVSLGIEQLMEGRPTRIISYQNIDKQTDLLRAMHNEMQRRGMTIDVTPTSAELTHEA